MYKNHVRSGINFYNNNDLLQQSIQHCEAINKGFTTSLSKHDYFDICTLLEQTRPKRVLELGSGVSTVIIGKFLHKFQIEDGIKRTILSMEHEKEYLDNTQSMIPNEINKKADLVLSDVKYDNFDDGIISYYTSIPDHLYDFVLIDGPSIKIDILHPHISDIRDRISRGGKRINYDLVRLLKSGNVDENTTIIVDNRLETCLTIPKLDKRITLHRLPWRRTATFKISK
jgi:predicted O-methyltransferase YrrM